MSVLARALSTSTQPFKLAIVGSGPAGFYTAHKLLKECSDIKIDMFDRLPVPHGLVRFGVAPDHPEVKNVMTTFDKVAEDERFKFYGNVPVGISTEKSIPVEELKKHFDAIVFSYGASEDRKMNIPGEDLYGVESARTFVGWYNGHPDYKDLQLPLDDTDTAVIIGQGNVALDMARILLSPIDELRKTDITEYALDALSKSRIKHVHVVGRRGPVQVAFTTKELREQLALPDVQFNADHEFIKQQIEESLSIITKNRPLKRLMALLEKGSSTKGSKSWNAQFLRSPVEILPTADNKRVAGIKYELNRLEGPLDKRMAVGTGEYEQQECGIVLKSIGYKSVPVQGVPFDSRRGLIPNVYGKIMDHNQELPGMYAAGWVKRGPTGVIVSTMTDAYETATTIIEDIKNGKEMLHETTKEGADGLLNSMKEHQIVPVDYSDWKKIEASEFVRGSVLGKPREKYSSVEEMLSVIHRNT